MYLSKNSMKRKILMCLTISIYPFLPIIKEWNVWGGLVIELLILLFVGMTSLIKLKNGIAVLALNQYAVMLSVLLLVYCFINIKNTYIAFSGLRTFFLYIFFYTIENDVDGRSCGIVKTTSYASMAVAAIMSGGCIIQFIYPEIMKTMHNPMAWDELRAKTDWTPLGIYNRAISFMTDPNVLSVYLAFSLFLTFILFKKEKRNIYLFFMFFESVSVVLTQSRTGMFIVVIYMLLSVVMEFIRERHLTWYKTFVVCLSGLLGLYVLINKLDIILKFLRVDTLASGNGRAEKNILHLNLYFSDVLKIILGNGLFDGRKIIFENSYLSIAYMFGIIGSFILLILACFLFKDLIKCENAELLLCYAAVAFVGDYILIPQITLVVILCLLANSKIVNLKRRGKDENSSNIIT